MPTRPKSASAIAREKRKTASLCGWRNAGTATAAAKAGDVSVSGVRKWFREDADYRGRVMAAIDEYAASAGQETANALLEHVRAAARGDMVVTKRGTEGGKPTQLEERVALNPALARLLLTRADPRFTHPKQELEHSGTLTVQEALDDVAAALAEHDGRQAPTPPPTQGAPEGGPKGGVSAADLDEALGE